MESLLLLDSIYNWQHFNNADDYNIVSADRCKSYPALHWNDLKKSENFYQYHIFYIFIHLPKFCALHDSLE